MQTGSSAPRSLSLLLFLVWRKDCGDTYGVNVRAKETVVDT